MLSPGMPVDASSDSIPAREVFVCQRSSEDAALQGNAGLKFFDQLGCEGSTTVLVLPQFVNRINTTVHDGAGHIQLVVGSLAAGVARNIPAGAWFRQRVQGGQSDNVSGEG